ncbi:T9SS type A sorting domain-containing protein [Pontibacter sp. CAU 1760]
MEKGTTQYSQNFDTLPALKDDIWENGTSYIDGWYVQRTKQTNTLAINPGNQVAGNLYSYGATGSTERALGSQSSLNAGEFAWGLLLHNNTGGTVHFVNVSFYGEQWRISNKTAGEHKIDFYYAVSADPTSFKLSPKSDNGWVPYPELNFKSPHYFKEGKALDGNAASNRKLMAAMLNVELRDGEFLMLRWKDLDELEVDHALAIDDFTISWTVEDKPVVVLPVELTRFTAHSQGSAVTLHWATASEYLNDHFVVERSLDAKDFEVLAKVKGQGTTSKESIYSFTDESPMDGASYYRLKQVDEDGTYKYSKTVAVMRQQSKLAYKAYPTIVSDFLELEQLGVNGLYSAVILDAVGKKLIERPLNPAKRRQQLDVQSLRNGTYILVLSDEKGTRHNFRFLKQ